MILEETGGGSEHYKIPQEEQACEHRISELGELETQSLVTWRHSLYSHFIFFEEAVI
ncbi:hypothetical protein I79_026085 [Cricetulus griseus]|uniref:Uncharacterized protein n=1 Tax=Cricetulus griseus TaxID=10029 RepID=G3IQ00_CRIGR|nr:hypothetical protein I79_026085 [Cricetulus griseus]